MERKAELLEAMRKTRQNREFHIYALMVTDILSKSTELLVAGDAGLVARIFEVQAEDSVVFLPGVMSRKKEVAPRLMAAL
jgi:manganese-dependent inorganic pyrophosphatase